MGGRDRRIERRGLADGPNVPERGGNTLDP